MQPLFEDTQTDRNSLSRSEFRLVHPELNTHLEFNDQQRVGWLVATLYSICALVVGCLLPVVLIVMAAGGAKLNDVRFDSPNAIARSLNAPFEASAVCGMVLACGTFLRFTIRRQRWLRLIIYCGIIALISIAITQIFFTSIGHSTPIKGYDSYRFLRLGMSIVMLVCGTGMLAMLIQRIAHHAKPSINSNANAG